MNHIIERLWVKCFRWRWRKIELYLDSTIDTKNENTKWTNLSAPFTLNAQPMRNSRASSIFIVLLMSIIMSKFWWAHLSTHTNVTSMINFSATIQYTALFLVACGLSLLALALSGLSVQRWMGRRIPSRSCSLRGSLPACQHFLARLRSDVLPVLPENPAEVRGQWCQQLWHSALAWHGECDDHWIWFTEKHSASLGNPKTLD